MIKIIIAVLMLHLSLYADELPKGFVYLSDVDDSIVQDIRYAKEHNFLGRPAAGYEKPVCILTKNTAKALSKAQKVFLSKGYSLKVFDCYRPQKAVDDFKSWSMDGDNVMKNEYYQEYNKDSLFRAGFLASKSGHSRGSKVDITLIKLPYGGDEPYYRGIKNKSCSEDFMYRFMESNVDMGTNFDCFSKKSFTESNQINAEAKKNRKLIVTVMTENGFKNYKKEWWDFTFINEMYPNKYFNFNVK